MRFDIHRFYQNREAVIKGTALFLLDVILIIACMVYGGSIMDAV